MATDHEETSSAESPAFYFPQALIEAADSDEAIEAYLDNWSEADLEAAKKHLALTAAAAELLEACEFTLDMLDHLASADYARGGDREARLKLTAAVAKAQGQAA